MIPILNSTNISDIGSIVGKVYQNKDELIVDFYKQADIEFDELVNMDKVICPSYSIEDREDGDLTKASIKITHFNIVDYKGQE